MEPSTPRRAGRHRRLAAGVLSVAVLTGVGAGWSDAPRQDLPGLANGATWRTTTSQLPGIDGLGPVLATHFADLAWLLGGRPAPAGRHEELANQALLDLRGLQRPQSGAILAGPAGIWAYTWPRDSAFVAAALARSGHVSDAWRALMFLRRVQGEDGGFEARYLPDGSGVPDDRPAQGDGCGWVLWGMDRVRASADATVPADLRVLRDRCVDNLMALTNRGRELPPATPDYWEVPQTEVSLGLVAPMVAGMQAAANLYSSEGGSRFSDVSVAASQLRAVVVRTFGPDFERYGSSGGLDAAVAMFVPPFVAAGPTGPERELVEAWRAYPARASRAAGGVAPGTAWKQDGISWTPETALVAYTAASMGEVAVAGRLLDWLEEHRTTWGSLPEKVKADGSPAGPAPLAWTAALVVLTCYELDGQTP